MLAVADRLYQESFGRAPLGRRPLPGDGSKRRMLRLEGPEGHTAIAVQGPDQAENRAFLSFSRTLRELGLPVPEVYGADELAGVYLVEDLGDVTLYDALLAGRGPDSGLTPALHATYRKVLSWLVRFQVEGGRRIDYAQAHPRARYDAQAMLWDCNYFKYDFLKLAHVPFHEARLEDDFRSLARWLEEAPGGHFMHRDLQSRNIMLRAGEPWFIDYQGGLQGPLQYDVAKLLYEGKAQLPEAARAELLAHYLDVLAEHVPLDRERFLAHYRGFVVLRILQGLGAYGLLGLHERKPQFLARIPHALRDIEGLLATGFVPLDLPELRLVFERLVRHETLRAQPALPNGRLLVRVGSFAYARGVPGDPAGHGGGFVFDCRALPNPGRLAEYAGRSGLDPEVATWLGAHPALGPFLERALGLVEAQVQAYRERGFASLQVLFGCTGGQHRSVYLAERLAAALSARFPDLALHLQHAEALSWPASAAQPVPRADPARDT